MPPDRRTNVVLMEPSLVQKTLSLKMPTSVAELAYLAGIFDGEGTVTVRTVKSREYGGVAVSNTDRALIKWLARFGGGVTVNRHPKTDTQVCYSWYLSRSDDTIDFLEALLPFLIIKKERAQSKLDFLYSRRDSTLARYASQAERDREILRLWQLGHATYRGISRIVGCSKTTVKSVVDNAA